MKVYIPIQFLRVIEVIFLKAWFGGLRFFLGFALLGSLAEAQVQNPLQRACRQASLAFYSVDVRIQETPTQGFVGEMAFCLNLGAGLGVDAQSLEKHQLWGLESLAYKDFIRGKTCLSDFEVIDSDQRVSGVCRYSDSSQLLVR